MSDHLDVWAAETAALEPTEWEHWAAELKNILGHDLDGDEDHDGYSYDGFYEMWGHGLSPVAAALRTFPGRRAEFAKYEDAQRQYVQSAQAIADLATAMASGTYPGTERRSAVEAMRGHIDRLDRARDVLDTPTSEKPLQSWEEYQRSGEFMNAVLGPLPPMPEVPHRCRPAATMTSLSRPRSLNHLHPDQVARCSSTRSTPPSPPAWVVVT